MTWRPIDGSTAVNDAGVTVSRRGRSVLRYDTGDRHIDFTLESADAEASVYTGEAETWQPSGEPFTPADRRLAERHITEALRTLGVAVDFG